TVAPAQAPTAAKENESPRPPPPASRLPHARHKPSSQTHNTLRMEASKHHRIVAHISAGCARHTGR
ncbi:MAG: hypothetical protein ACXVCT_14600, partial [Ktedonobacterales bacterium]